MHLRQTEAAAWRLAAELVRWHPTWGVIAGYVGDGPEEALCLIDVAPPPRCCRLTHAPLFVSRPATVRRPVPHPDTSVVWETLTSPGGVGLVTNTIHEQLGVALPKQQWS